MSDPVTASFQSKVPSFTYRAVLNRPTTANSPYICGKLGSKRSDGVRNHSQSLIATKALHRPKGPNATTIIAKNTGVADDSRFIAMKAPAGLVGLKLRSG